MKDYRQIQYWAHMLDESRHASYYDVYMQQHPEDKMPKILQSLISDFSKDIKKDGIDLEECIVNGKANFSVLDSLKKKVKHTYSWELISALVYAAIISRSTALMTRTKGQRLQEDNEIQFDDVSRMVSRRTVEQCLDIMCHNTNVLSANTALMSDPDKFASIFKSNGIPEVPSHSDFLGKDVKYGVAAELYAVWASYATGKYGEKYVCDSHNGPTALVKVLSSVEYSADDLDLVVALNKALDVVHARSDLAAAFIEGGQQTCLLVSNLPDKFVI